MLGETDQAPKIAYCIIVFMRYCTKAKKKKKSERKRLVVPGVGEYRENLEYKGTVQAYFGGDKTILYGSEVVDIWLQIDQKPVCYRANVVEEILLFS